MRKRSFVLTFLFLYSLCSMLTLAHLAAQGEGAVEADFENSLMHYFEAKNDDILKKTILVYDMRKGDTENYDNTVILFYAGIKSREQKRYDQFYKTVMAGKNAKLKEIFEFLQVFDLAEFMNGLDISPQLNDYLWLLYFATGDDEFLIDLFSIAQKFFNETEDVTRFLASRSSAWSIKMNIAGYPSVKKFFSSSGKKFLGADLVKYINENDTEKIQADAVDYIKDKREKGIW